MTRLHHILPFVIATTTISAAARAEVLRTTTRATLRAEPAESARAVARLDTGREVKVLERTGRWLRVESPDGKGWLTRTTVAETALTERAERPTRVESWRRRDAEVEVPQAVAAGRQVEVVRPQNAFREPSARARIAFRAPTGSVLTVVNGSKGKSEWLLVENEHGHVGWVPALAVAALREPVSAAATLADSASAPRAGLDSALAPRITAAAGVRMLSMDFTSNGAGELAGYSISSPTLGASVSASMPLMPSSSRLVVQLDGEYRLAYANPGLQYTDAAGTTSTIPFSIHEANAAGVLGYREPQGGFFIGARLGYHYEAFYVDAVNNTGLLPRERLQGLRFGARAAYAPDSGAYLVRAGIDALTGGARNQTPGLEDGTTSSASAWWAHLAVDYPLFDDVALMAQYGLQRASTSWSGQSTRQPDVTEASRTDTSHMVSVGVARSF